MPAFASFTFGGGSFFVTFLDLAMSAGIGVRKRSINDTTLLSLSSSSCSDSDSSELYSILMVLKVVQPQPLLDAITATRN